MNSVMNCMVSLSALEIMSFFLAGAICEKEENWLLVSLIKAIATQNIRMFESTVLLQSKSIHAIFNILRLTHLTF